jgi:hypothetical protein
MARKRFSPLVSMNVTSLRSTRQARPLRVRLAVLQFALSSPTQGPNRRPCRTQRISIGLSVMVIFSTFPTLASAWYATENCNGRAKPRRLRETTEFVDLYGIAHNEVVRQIMLAACQGQLYGRMAVFCHMRPKRGGCTVTTQNAARFRVYSFSTAGLIASYQDAPLHHWDLPQPNCTV